ncbi:MAG: YihY/virulence factor BrkB family protein [Terriglobia bacterium]
MPANLEKLRTGVRTRTQLADVFLSSIRYLFQTEVHAYAFSIAANAYLSFFPFNLILLVVCQRWLHWESAYLMVLQLLRVHLPSGSESLIRNLVAVVQGRPRLQLVSVFMLLFTSSGVFLPLEIALNKVWGFRRNRSFLRNQSMSFMLAFISGMLALLFIVAITPVHAGIAFSLGRVPYQSILTTMSRVILEVASMPFMALIYLLIYYYLPNGKVPIGRVLPAALATGILTEVGTIIYSLTLPMFRFREVYGPFALSVTLLFWAYAGAMLLLFGAHLSAHGFILHEDMKVTPAQNGNEKLGIRS